MPTNTQNFRSSMKSEFVREEVQRDGKVLVIRAELPVGRGWNDGTAISWINMGWKSAAEYDAAKHLEAVQAEKPSIDKKAKQKVEA